MKPKKLNTTFALNKITVANLPRDEQKIVLGGEYTLIDSTCKNCGPSLICTGPCETELATCGCWTHSPDYTCDTCHC